MDMTTRIKYLRIALIISGLISIFCIYPAIILWPSGWRWIPYQSNYEQMIVGIYMTLGVFLLLAAKDPLQNLSLIWFTVWSSFVHGGIMLLQAVVYAHELGHLLGDVPAVLLMGIILAILTPRKKSMVIKRNLSI